jgi:tetratricopeptide (TPR) repeat protein
MAVQTLLTDDELLALAGKQAFARGRSYFAGDRVALSRHDDDGLEGEAKGSEIYSLWLKRGPAGWRWNCSCPAADGGGFCKHLVAAVLTAREAFNDEAGIADAVPPGSTSKSSASKSTASRYTASRYTASERNDDLADFLHAQSPERLSGWLLTFAEEDAAIEKRLRLYRAADDPAALRAALGRMLDAGGLLDYRRSIAYARRLEAVTAQLEDAIARDADVGRRLCEYAVGRLLKIYERSDDSAGGIGQRLREFAELHVRACTVAPPPGKALAKWLHELQPNDDWNIFALDVYWELLGSDGQAEYGRRAIAQFQKLPKNPTEDSRWSAETFGIMRTTEAFARASGDFDLLQRVLRRHLSQPHDFLGVLQSLREFDRSREALDWAEQAVKRFPDDAGLRNALAECLAAAGLDDDAADQAWRAFCLRPDTQRWDALKRITGKQWPTWRERSLTHVASRERDDASLRAQLLEHDGDFAAAVALAGECRMRPDVLERLARGLERSAPVLAGEFYMRIAHLQAPQVDYSRYTDLVRTLQSAARCLAAEQWKPFVAKLRAEHGRKSKLMKLLVEAGL